MTPLEKVTELSATVAALKTENKKLRNLLSRCYAGFSAFIHGRKLSRKERDALRAEIAETL